ncbi:SseB family protein [Clavibacter capsici]|uniref:SseB family protein n=1 Tax=Clavibacter capsici TaxID=1874630 RepID=UPI0035CA29DA
MPMLAAFTHEDRIDEKVTSVADHVATIPAAELVQAIPEGTGLVINVGTTDGFEMMPEGVAQLADDVRRVIDQDGDAPQAPAAPSPDAV